MDPRRILALLSLVPALAFAADPVTDPAATEVWSPVPAKVATPENVAPSDAVVLFDGTNLDAWQSEKSGAAPWEVKDGILTIKPGSGSIVTREAFSDCQLHIEWRSPAPATGEGQMRGNSGLFFQGLYEVQILDSFNSPTYANGQAASVYKQFAPLVNASRAPGAWQSYDIVFHAPRFNVDGSLKAPARMTVLHNGVLVQDNVELAGGTVYIGKPAYERHAFELPLSIQDHGCPVSFRNIWIRRLNTRELLNPELAGWYPFLEDSGQSDPEGNFKWEDGALHIMGKHFGYLATRESFRNYHLTVVFKWGENRYPPREKWSRDSGVLYHFATNEPDIVWPKSIECQIQENDCGDVWCVGTTMESPNASKEEYGMKHILRNACFENPRGEWNTVEIVADGDTVQHFVNGHLVMTGTRASVSEGRILLQSEGAEVFYRSVRLTPY